MKSSKDIEKDLRGIVAGGIYPDTITRTLYATDASMFRVLPQIVIEPKSYEDIRNIIQYATAHQIPIAPRGAGSGLAGESLTTGIVLDFSLHLNKIIHIDNTNSTATIQSGVVRGILNKELKKEAKLFGPDPATSNRCTLGGMIANNSTGAHSLIYGMTRENVISIKVMLYDGSIVTLQNYDINGAELQNILNSDTAQSKIYKSLIDSLNKHANTINEEWPAAPRNRHGYLLKDVLTENSFNPAKLFSGSEGTLGILLEAVIKTHDIPHNANLVYYSFKNRLDAAKATPHILTENPGAVEIIDEYCMEMVRENKTYDAFFNKGESSLLLVEFNDVPEEVKNKLSNIEELLHNNGIECSSGECKTDKDKAFIWNMRTLISGMINKSPGVYQPVPLIEDVCIHPDKLFEYLLGLEKLLEKKGIQFLAFGHAGDGTVHVRPYIDRKNAETLKELPSICTDVYKFSLSLSGSISGEHGDGYLRAPFIKIQYPKLFDYFKEIKELFDPNNIFNPDKKTGCNDFSKWEQNLRFGPEYKPRKLETILKWKDGEFLHNIEACNGCGVCRSTVLDIDMCPVFRAVGHEAATSRAKINLTQNFLTGNLDQVPIEELRKVTDLCLNCKMCAVDCPAGVNSADIMIEMKAQIGRIVNFDRATNVLLYMEQLLRFVSPLAFLQRIAISFDPVKKFMEISTGLSAKRTPPKLSGKPFLKRYKDTIIPAPNSDTNTIKVAYFVDMFSDLISPQIAETFLKILKHNNIEVSIPKQKGSDIVNFTYGNIKRVTKNADFNVAELSKQIDLGYSIVCTEPTAALTLQEEYIRINNTESYLKVSNNSFDASTFLLSLFEQNLMKTEMKSVPVTLGYHRPCHIKKLGAADSTIHLMEYIPGVKLVDIDKGCCGIAGTFGMKKKNYETSMKIGEPLFKELKNSNLDFGLTECSTCKLQMEHGAPNLKVKHPLEIIAEAYRI